MTKFSNQLYILLFSILFTVSTTILLIASTAKSPIPAWSGYLDVTMVFLIAITGFIIYRRNKSAPRYNIGHQVAIYLFPLILLGMWIYRASLDFNILLPGAAWRVYFFLSILPYAINLWKPEQHQ